MNLIRLIICQGCQLEAAKSRPRSKTDVLTAIAIIAIAMHCDPYIIDTLMRDLVEHSRSSAAFLVYLQLYRHTHGAGRESVAMSHSVLAEFIGISKRSVQTALAHLIDRRLIRQRKP